MGRAEQSRFGRASELHLFLVLSMGILFLAGCGLTEDDIATRDAGTRLQSADNGSSIDVRWGEHIVVELDSDPTSGFEWAIKDINPSMLGYAGSVYEPADAGQVRKRGKQRLSFQVLNTGTSPLRLKYWRSWEGDSSVAEEFEVTANVGGR